MTSTTTDRRFGVNSGMALKVPCIAASVSNITLSGLQTIDGVTLVDGDRVLVTGQTTAADNGIWEADTGTWTRTPDFNGSFDAVKGTLIYVTDGSTYGESFWTLNTDNVFVIGTTGLTFGQFFLGALSTLTFTQSGTGATARNANTKMQEILSPEDFGATGDGVADDTAEFQAAITAVAAAGGGTVRGVNGKTYLVSFVGAKTINAIANRYCLLIPDNVFVDLNGATVKLAAAQNAAIFMNSTAGTTQNADLGVGNGIIDGNQANQTSPGAGDMPCLHFYTVLRPRFVNLKAKNVRQYAGRFLNCTRGHFDHLDCDDSDGDGWSFGTSGSAEFRLFECFIDNIYAKDCNGTYGGTIVGNGCIFTVVDCKVGKVYNKNCAAGLKIQNSSEDSQFALLEFVGGVLSTTNSGVKVQGDLAATLYPKRITIDSAVTRDATGYGLYIQYVDFVQIGKYTGYSNGVASAGIEDVRIEPNAGGIVQIDDIVLDSPADTPGISVAGTGHHIQLGNIFVKNPFARCMQISSVSSYCTIDSLAGYDDRGGSATMTHILNITNATASGYCRVVRSNLVETGQSRIGLLGSFNVVQAYLPLPKSPKYEIFDDFIGEEIDGYRWQGLVGTDAECVEPIVLSGQTGGVVRMTTGDDVAATMAVNGVQLQQALNWTISQEGLAAEFRLKVSAITNVAVYFGFTDQVSALEMPFTLGAGDALTSNTTDGAGVLFDTAADTDQWCLVGVANNVDATKQFAGVAPVADTYEVWRVEVTSAGVARFYRNGALVGTAMTAAIAAGIQLTPVIAAFSRTTASRTIDSDYIRVSQNRST